MKETENERTSKWASLSKKTTKTASPYAKLADVSGYGVKPYEGEDVIEHLKEKVAEQDKIDLVHQEVAAIKKSSWLQTLEKEKKQKAERDEREKKARAARLAILFEEDEAASHDDDDE